MNIITFGERIGQKTGKKPVGCYHLLRIHCLGLVDGRDQELFGVQTVKASLTHSRAISPEPVPRHNCSGTIFGVNWIRELPLPPCGFPLIVESLRMNWLTNSQRRLRRGRFRTITYLGLPPKSLEPLPDGDNSQNSQAFVTVTSSSSL